MGSQRVRHDWVTNTYLGLTPGREEKAVEWGQGEFELQCCGHIGLCWCWSREDLCRVVWGWGRGPKSSSLYMDPQEGVQHCWGSSLPLSGECWVPNTPVRELGVEWALQSWREDWRGTAWPPLHWPRNKGKEFSLEGSQRQVDMLIWVFTEV